MTHRVPLTLLLAATAIVVTATAALACERTHAAKSACNTVACPASACTAAARSACDTPACPASACTKTTATFVPLPAAAPVAAPAALPSLAPPAPAIVSGLMAFIDPETGTITGSIAGLTPPADLFRAQPAPVTLTPVTLPDGSLMLDLQGTLQDFLVLRVDPLGRRSFTCSDAPTKLPPLAPLPTPTPAPER